MFEQCQWHNKAAAAVAALQNDGLPPLNCFFSPVELFELVLGPALFFYGISALGVY
jgi:hypothetical protein